MAPTPVVIPDGAKIAELIRDRGFSSYAEFARTLRSPRRSRAVISYIANDGRASVRLMRQVAKALGVDISEITASPGGESELPGEAAA